MPYSGSERRKYPRVEGRFIISYRILSEPDNADISQTKNISMGGMLLTTNRKFETGTELALKLRLPFDPNPIMLTGKVLESREVFKNLIYDTRIIITSLDEHHKKAIKDTVDHYLDKEKGQPG